MGRVNVGALLAGGGILIAQQLPAIDQRRRID